MATVPGERPHPISAALKRARRRDIAGKAAAIQAALRAGHLGQHAAQLSAEAFAWLIGLAPRPADVPLLDPAPSWAAWDHGEAGLWPRPEDDDVDLNEVDGPQWIDRAAGCARDRLRAGVCEVVIGHCDWLADNLRWRGDELLVVHDWDSAVADSEAALVGFAAALYSTVSPDELATVEETDRFLDAYRAARG
jgi:hypothetical protein